MSVSWKCALHDVTSSYFLLVQEAYGTSVYFVLLLAVMDLTEMDECVSGVNICALEQVSQLLCGLFYLQSGVATIRHLKTLILYTAFRQKVVLRKIAY